MVFDSNLIDTLAETILRIGEGKETPSIAIGILDSLAQERYFSIRKANTETMLKCIRSLFGETGLIIFCEKTVASKNLADIRRRILDLCNIVIRYHSRHCVHHLTSIIKISLNTFLTDDSAKSKSSGLFLLEVAIESGLKIGKFSTDSFDLDSIIGSGILREVRIRGSKIPTLVRSYCLRLLGKLASIFHSPLQKLEPSTNWISDIREQILMSLRSNTNVSVTTGADSLSVTAGALTGLSFFLDAFEIDPADAVATYPVITTVICCERIPNQNSGFTIPRGYLGPQRAALDLLTRHGSFWAEILCMDAELIAVESLQGEKKKGNNFATMTRAIGEVTGQRWNSMLRADDSEDNGRELVEIDDQSPDNKNNVSKNAVNLLEIISKLTQSSNVTLHKVAAAALEGILTHISVFYIQSYSQTKDPSLATRGSRVLSLFVDNLQDHLIEALLTLAKKDEVSDGKRRAYLSSLRAFALACSTIARLTNDPLPIQHALGLISELIDSTLSQRVASVLSSLPDLLHALLLVLVLSTNASSQRITLSSQTIDRIVDAGVSAFACFPFAFARSRKRFANSFAAFLAGLSLWETTDYSLVSSVTGVASPRDIMRMIVTAGVSKTILPFEVLQAASSENGAHILAPTTSTLLEDEHTSLGQPSAGAAASMVISDNLSQRTILLELWQSLRGGQLISNGSTLDANHDSQTIKFFGTIVDSHVCRLLALLKCDSTCQGRPERGIGGKVGHSLRLFDGIILECMGGIRPVRDVQGSGLMSSLKSSGTEDFDAEGDEEENFEEDEDEEPYRNNEDVDLTNEISQNEFSSRWILNIVNRARKSCDETIVLIRTFAAEQLVILLDQVGDALEICEREEKKVALSWISEQQQSQDELTLGKNNMFLRVEGDYDNNTSVLSNTLDFSTLRLLELSLLSQQAGLNLEILSNASFFVNSILSLTIFESSILKKKFTAQNRHDGELLHSSGLFATISPIRIAELRNTCCELLDSCSRIWLVLQSRGHLSSQHGASVLSITLRCIILLVALPHAGRMSTLSDLGESPILRDFFNDILSPASSSLPPRSFALCMRIAFYLPTSVLNIDRSVEMVRAALKMGATSVPIATVVMDFMLRFTNVRNSILSKNCDWTGFDNFINTTPDNDNSNAKKSVYFLPESVFKSLIALLEPFIGLLLFSPASETSDQHISSMVPDQTFSNNFDDDNGGNDLDEDLLNPNDIMLSSKELEEARSTIFGNEAGKGSDARYTLRSRLRRLISRIGPHLSASIALKSSSFDSISHLSSSDDEIRDINHNLKSFCIENEIIDGGADDDDNPDELIFVRVDSLPASFSGSSKHQILIKGGRLGGDWSDVELPVPIGTTVWNLRSSGLILQLAATAESSSNRQSSIAAAESLHAWIGYLTSCDGSSDCDTPHSRTLLALLPAMLRLGCSNDLAIKSLFEPLVKSVSRWLGWSARVNSTCSNSSSSTTALALQKFHEAISARIASPEVRTLASICCGLVLNTMVTGLDVTNRDAHERIQFSNGVLGVALCVELLDKSVSSISDAIRAGMSHVEQLKAGLGTIVELTSALEACSAVADKYAPTLFISILESCGRINSNSLPSEILAHTILCLERLLILWFRSPLCSLSEANFRSSDDIPVELEADDFTKQVISFLFSLACCHPNAVLREFAVRAFQTYFSPELQKCQSMVEKSADYLIEVLKKNDVYVNSLTGDVDMNCLTTKLQTAAFIHQLSSKSMNELIRREKANEFSAKILETPTGDYISTLSQFLLNLSSSFDSDSSSNNNFEQTNKFALSRDAISAAINSILFIHLHREFDSCDDKQFSSGSSICLTFEIFLIALLTPWKLKQPVIGTSRANFVLHMAIPFLQTVCASPKAKQLFCLLADNWKHSNPDFCCVSPTLSNPTQSVDNEIPVIPVTCTITRFVKAMERSRRTGASFSSRVSTFLSALSLLTHICDLRLLSVSTEFAISCKAILANPSSLLHVGLTAVQLALCALPPVNASSFSKSIVLALIAGLASFHARTSLSPETLLGLAPYLPLAIESLLSPSSLKRLLFRDAVAASSIDSNANSPSANNNNSVAASKRKQVDEAVLQSLRPIPSTSSLKQSNWNISHSTAISQFTVPSFLFLIVSCLKELKVIEVNEAKNVRDNLIASGIIHQATQQVIFESQTQGTKSKKEFSSPARRIAAAASSSDQVVVNAKQTDASSSVPIKEQIYKAIFVSLSRSSDLPDCLFTIMCDSFIKIMTGDLTLIDPVGKHLLKSGRQTSSVASDVPALFGNGSVESADSRLPKIPRIITSNAVVESFHPSGSDSENSIVKTENSMENNGDVKREQFRNKNNEDLISMNGAQSVATLSFAMIVDLILSIANLPSFAGLESKFSAAVSSACAQSLENLNAACEMQNDTLSSINSDSGLNSSVSVLNIHVKCKAVSFLGAVPFRLPPDLHASLPTHQKRVIRSVECLLSQYMPIRSADILATTADDLHPYKIALSSLLALLRNSTPPANSAANLLPLNASLVFPDFSSDTPHVLQLLLPSLRETHHLFQNSIDSAISSYLLALQRGNDENLMRHLLGFACRVASTPAPSEAVRTPQAGVFLESLRVALFERVIIPIVLTSPMPRIPSLWKALWPLASSIIVEATNDVSQLSLLADLLAVSAYTNSNLGETNIHHLRSDPLIFPLSPAVFKVQLTAAVLGVLEALFTRTPVSLLRAEIAQFIIDGSTTGADAAAGISKFMILNCKALKEASILPRDLYIFLRTSGIADRVADSNLVSSVSIADPHIHTNSPLVRTLTFAAERFSSRVFGALAACICSTQTHERLFTQLLFDSNWWDSLVSDSSFATSSSGEFDVGRFPSSQPFPMDTDFRMLERPVISSQFGGLPRKIIGQGRHATTLKLNPIGRSRARTLLSAIEAAGVANGEDGGLGRAGVSSDTANLNVRNLLDTIMQCTQEINRSTINSSASLLAPTGENSRAPSSHLYSATQKLAHGVLGRSLREISQRGDVGRSLTATVRSLLLSPTQQGNLTLSDASTQYNDILARFGAQSRKNLANTATVNDNEKKNRLRMIPSSLGNLAMEVNASRFNSQSSAYLPTHYSKLEATSSIKETSSRLGDVAETLSSLGWSFDSSLAFEEDMKLAFPHLEMTDEEIEIRGILFGRIGGNLWKSEFLEDDWLNDLSSVHILLKIIDVMFINFKFHWLKSSVWEKYDDRKKHTNDPQLLNIGYVSTNEALIPDFLSKWILALKSNPKNFISKLIFSRVCILRPNVFLPFATEVSKFLICDVLLDPRLGANKSFNHMQRDIVQLILFFESRRVAVCQWYHAVLAADYSHFNPNDPTAANSRNRASNFNQNHPLSALSTTIGKEASEALLIQLCRVSTHPNSYWLRTHVSLVQLLLSKWRDTIDVSCLPLSALIKTFIKAADPSGVKNSGAFRSTGLLLLRAVLLHSDDMLVSRLTSSKVMDGLISAIDNCFSFPEYRVASIAASALGDFCCLHPCKQVDDLAVNHAARLIDLILSGSKDHVNVKKAASSPLLSTSKSSSHALSVLQALCVKSPVCLIGSAGSATRRALLDLTTHTLHANESTRPKILQILCSVARLVLISLDDLPNGTSEQPFNTQHNNNISFNPQHTPSFEKKKKISFSACLYEPPSSSAFSLPTCVKKWSSRIDRLGSSFQTFLAAVLETVSEMAVVLQNSWRQLLDTGSTACRANAALLMLLLAPVSSVEVNSQMLPSIHHALQCTNDLPLPNDPLEPCLSEVLADAALWALDQPTTVASPGKKGSVMRMIMRFAAGDFALARSTSELSSVSRVVNIKVRAQSILNDLLPNDALERLIVLLTEVWSPSEPYVVSCMLDLLSKSIFNPTSADSRAAIKTPLHKNPSNLKFVNYKSEISSACSAGYSLLAGGTSSKSLQNPRDSSSSQLLLSSFGNEASGCTSACSSFVARTVPGLLSHNLSSLLVTDDHAGTSNPSTYRNVNLSLINASLQTLSQSAHLGAKQAERLVRVFLQQEGRTQNVRASLGSQAVASSLSANHRSSAVPFPLQQVAACLLSNKLQTDKIRSSTSQEKASDTSSLRTIRAQTMIPSAISASSSSSINRGRVFKLRQQEARKRTALAMISTLADAEYLAEARLTRDAIKLGLLPDVEVTIGDLLGSVVLSSAQIGANTILEIICGAASRARGARSNEKAAMLRTAVMHVIQTLSNVVIEDKISVDHSLVITFIVALVERVQKDPQFKINHLDTSYLTHAAIASNSSVARTTLLVEDQIISVCRAIQLTLDESSAKARSTGTVLSSDSAQLQLLGLITPSGSQSHDAVTSNSSSLQSGVKKKRSHHNHNLSSIMKGVISSDGSTSALPHHSNDRSFMNLVYNSNSLGRRRIRKSANPRTYPHSDGFTSGGVNENNNGLNDADNIFLNESENGENLSSNGESQFPLLSHLESLVTLYGKGTQEASLSFATLELLSLSDPNLNLKMLLDLGIADISGAGVAEKHDCLQKLLDEPNIPDYYEELMDHIDVKARSAQLSLAEWPEVPPIDVSGSAGLLICHLNSCCDTDNVNAVIGVNKYSDTLDLMTSILLKETEILSDLIVSSPSLSISSITPFIVGALYAISKADWDVGRSLTDAAWLFSSKVHETTSLQNLSTHKLTRASFLENISILSSIDETINILASKSALNCFLHSSGPHSSSAISLDAWLASLSVSAPVMVDSVNLISLENSISAASLGACAYLSIQSSLAERQYGADMDLDSPLFEDWHLKGRLGCMTAFASMTRTALNEECISLAQSTLKSTLKLHKSLTTSKLSSMAHNDNTILKSLRNNDLDLVIQTKLLELEGVIASSLPHSYSDLIMKKTSLLDTVIAKEEALHEPGSQYCFSIDMTKFKLQFARTVLLDRFSSEDQKPSYFFMSPSAAMTWKSAEKLSSSLLHSSSSSTSIRVKVEKNTAASVGLSLWSFSEMLLNSMNLFPVVDFAKKEEDSDDVSVTARANPDIFSLLPHDLFEFEKRNEFIKSTTTLDFSAIALLYISTLCDAFHLEQSSSLIHILSTRVPAMIDLFISTNVLATTNDENNIQLVESIKHAFNSLPSSVLSPWVSQLCNGLNSLESRLTHFMSKSKKVDNTAAQTLLAQYASCSETAIELLAKCIRRVAKSFPQQVFYPLNTTAETSSHPSALSSQILDEVSKNALVAAQFADAIHMLSDPAARLKDLHLSHIRDLLALTYKRSRGGQGKSLGENLRDDHMNELNARLRRFAKFVLYPHALTSLNSSDIGLDNVEFATVMSKEFASALKLNSSSSIDIKSSGDETYGEANKKVEKFIEKFLELDIKRAHELINGVIKKHTQQSLVSWLPSALHQAQTPTNRSKAGSLTRVASISSNSANRRQMKQNLNVSSPFEFYCSWFLTYKGSHTNNSANKNDSIGSLIAPSCQSPSHRRPVVIINFLSDLSVFNSKQKPKKFSAMCSDKRSRPFLAKAGDDLRLDDRLGRLFTLFNQLFCIASNESLSKFNSLDSRTPAPAILSEFTDARIRTYPVVSTGAQLGVLGWVAHTAPLKSVLETELDLVLNGSAKDGESARESIATASRSKHSRNGGAAASTPVLERPEGVSNFIKFLSQALRGGWEGDGGRNGHMDVYAAVFKRPACEIGPLFANEVLAKYPSKYLIRDALSRAATDSEAFYKLRRTALESLAVFNACAYMFGIGDRHPDNFIIHYPSGAFIGIDFGYSLGVGARLPIPELVPFRLTPSLQGLSFPPPLPRVRQRAQMVGKFMLNDGQCRGVHFSLMTASLAVMRGGLNSSIGNLQRDKAHFSVENSISTINSRSVALLLSSFVKEPLIEWNTESHQREILNNTDTSDLQNDIPQEPPARVIAKERIHACNAKLAGYKPGDIVLSELKNSPRPWVQESLKSGDMEKIVLVNYIEYNPKRYTGDAEMFRSGTQSAYDQAKDLCLMATDESLLCRAWKGWAPYL